MFLLCWQDKQTSKRREKEIRKTVNKCVRKFMTFGSFCNFFCDYFWGWLWASIFGVFWLPKWFQKRSKMELRRHQNRCQKLHWNLFAFWDAGQGFPEGLGEARDGSYKRHPVLRKGFWGPKLRARTTGILIPEPKAPEPENLETRIPVKPN